MPNGPGLPNPPPPVDASSTDPSTPAVQGASLKSMARGGRQFFGPGDGVGVSGTSGSGAGVYGSSDTGSGVYGTSGNFDGVHGESQSNQHAGVSGTNNTQGGSGVWAEAKFGTGVWAHGNTTGGYFEGIGLDAQGTGKVAVGLSARGGTAGRFEGVSTLGPGFGVWANGHTAGHFETDGSPGAKAIEAFNTADGGFGVWASGSPAGHFESSKGNCVEAVGTADTDAIIATTTSPNHAALSGRNTGGGYADTLRPTVIKMRCTR